MLWSPFSCAREARAKEKGDHNMGARATREAMTVGCKPTSYIANARGSIIGTVALLCSVPPGRAQREPQGYAGLTTRYRVRVWGCVNKARY